MKHKGLPVNHIGPGSHPRIRNLAPAVVAHIHFRHIQMRPQRRQHLPVLFRGHSQEMLQLCRVPAGFRGRRIVARHPLRTQGNLPCRLAVYDVPFQLPHQCRQRRFLKRRIKQTQQIVVSSIFRHQVDQAAYQFRRAFRQIADDNTETSPLPQSAPYIPQEKQPLDCQYSVLIEGRNKLSDNLRFRPAP